MPTSRFAPTASGRAHPGTLLAALLCWLDARRAGVRLILRIEDIDAARCTDAFRSGLVEDLDWFGLDWDAVETQSAQADRHAAMLDALAAAGRLYPSQMSRRDLAAIGRRAPDGGWAYDNRERGAPLPAGGWRAAGCAVRCRLDDGVLSLTGAGGDDLSQDPAAAFGDPVVVGRTGAATYHLASVADDHAAGVDRIVRGRDLATATATQAALRRILGWPVPAYRHHLLVLEPAGGKFAKFHQSVAVPDLRAHLTAPALCGILAAAAGLREAPQPCTPADLLAGFAWTRVRTADVALAWDGRMLAPPP
jgi:glutamyl-Q tRNA(Asp) synthetase